MPDPAWRELYPFESHSLTLDGHRYHYLDEGAGPVVLLVHGNPTWSFYWRNLVLALRDRYRLVVPDHMGCGLSDKPADYPYLLSQHIRNLRYLIEQLDLRDISLVAHDWGGAIGLGAAGELPGRFARFTLLNTAAFRDTHCPLRIRVCRIPLLGKLAVQGFNAFAKAALVMATSKPERFTPAVKAGYLAPYDCWSNRIATHRFVLDIPLSPRHPSYRTLAAVEERLSQFADRPVQLIWGMRDWCFTPHFLHRFKDEFFPQAEVHEIPDAGHYVVEDAHEQIVPLLEAFLPAPATEPTPPPADPPAQPQPQAEVPRLRAIRHTSPVRDSHDADFELRESEPGADMVRGTVEHLDTPESEDEASATSELPAPKANSPGASTAAEIAPATPATDNKLIRAPVDPHRTPMGTDRIQAPRDPRGTVVDDRAEFQAAPPPSPTPTAGKHGPYSAPAPFRPNESVDDGVVNVARRLTFMARKVTEQYAVVFPRGRDAAGKRIYDRITFSQLDRVSDRLARGFRELGVHPGMRLALLVPPSIEFIALVFAMLKAGIVMVLIDPGMGRRNLIRCLRESQPEGFVGIPLVHTLRVLLWPRFRQAKFNVVVHGKSRLGRAVTFDQLKGGPWSGPETVATTADDPAAIIFTTGSTGPPKGVLYRHGNFDAQVEQIGQRYDIRPGEINLPGFPLFALFDAAMGVTTVVPDMDPTRPADVDPELIIEAINDWKVTQAFGSPAMWNRVGGYCDEHNVKLPTLRRVLSAGAPVPPHVLEWMTAAMPADGQMHTPYGATEALPVASISAAEVLGETATRWRSGGGTCVGSKFPGIEWTVIRITDGPIATFHDTEELPPGEIGELIVRGPVVTREYFQRPDATALAKIQGTDGEGKPTFWHRMGDVGYLDRQGRFWFCGRMAHRVVTAQGPMYTIPCEAIINQHPVIYRSALVGVGPRGRREPVIIAEPYRGQLPRNQAARQKLLGEIRELAAEHELTRPIRHFLLHPSLPVDIRHNSKIFREQLAVWAGKQVH